MTNQARTEMPDIASQNVSQKNWIFSRRIIGRACKNRAPIRGGYWWEFLDRRGNATCKRRSEFMEVLLWVDRHAFRNQPRVWTCSALLSQGRSRGVASEVFASGFIEGGQSKRKSKIWVQWMFCYNFKPLEHHFWEINWQNSNLCSWDM